METTLNIQSIPKTDSIEELAKFWDSHDVTDFEDALEEVAGPAFERLDASMVKIELPEKELAAIKQIAKERRVEPVMLVREWILEKLYYTELMRKAVKEFHAQ